jgi:type IV pilus assembly protein PilM
MAKTSAVWGIDIGNSSLKALRCTVGSEPGKIEALAFEHIEHSKILTQPDSKPQEIIAETLQHFLSRNVTKGDKVAVCVSGQNTISRFLKLPPVDPKKIPDIIKYEAKQWLPFDLDDVIWDFQPINHPDIDDPESMLESEVGMFAMKKDTALRSIVPYTESGISIDCIQSSPLAVYNYAAYDLLGIIGDDKYPHPDDPSRLVILSVGTDATDVVITNGINIWIRSFPIGGNVFTKALTKGLKLTFSKAEYLKRNASSAQDSQTVYKVMRPVINDMLAEVNRSLEYYQNLNKNTKITRIIALGNSMKLPGLSRYLTTNLGYEVTRLEKFQNLVGNNVVESPIFKENIMSFGSCYGLVLQVLNKSQLNTNLIPKEILTERMIRSKKPWVLAGAAALLLGLTVQFAAASRALETLSSELYSKSEKEAKTVISYSSDLQSQLTKSKSVYDAIDARGKNLTSNVEGRITWLELLRAVNQLLPVDRDGLADKKADEIAQQNRIFITSIDAHLVSDLSAWFATVKDRYHPDDEELLELMSGGGATAAAAAPKAAAPKAPAAKPAANTAATPTPAAAETPADSAAPENNTPKADAKIPTALTERLKLINGPPAVKGRVVQITGYHYHNPESATAVATDQMGADYLRNAFIRKLKFGRVSLPPTLEKQYSGNNSNANVEPVMVTMRELGVSFPTLLEIPKVVQTEIVNPRVLLEIYMEGRLRTPTRNIGGGLGASPGGFGGGGGGLGTSPGGFGPGGLGAPGRAENRRGETGFAEILADPFRGGTMDPAVEAYISERAKEMSVRDKIILGRFDFTIQFAWIETPPKAREDIKAKNEGKQNPQN